MKVKTMLFLCMIFVFANMFLLSALAIPKAKVSYNGFEIESLNMTKCSNSYCYVYFEVKALDKPTKAKLSFITDQFDIDRIDSIQKLNEEVLYYKDGNCTTWENLTCSSFEQIPVTTWVWNKIPSSKYEGSKTNNNFVTINKNNNNFRVKFKNILGSSWKYDVGLLSESGDEVLLDPYVESGFYYDSNYSFSDDLNISTNVTINSVVTNELEETHSQDSEYYCPNADWRWSTCRTFDWSSDPIILDRVYFQIIRSDGSASGLLARIEFTYTDDSVAYTEEIDMLTMTSWNTYTEYNPYPDKKLKYVRFQQWHTVLDRTAKIKNFRSYERYAGSNSSYISNQFLTNQTFKQIYVEVNSSDETAVSFFYNDENVDLNRWICNPGNNFTYSLKIDSTNFVNVSRVYMNFSTDDCNFESLSKVSITDGINDVLGETDVYYNQQVFMRAKDGTETMALVDVVAVYGNQRWLFNYVYNQSKTNLFNVSSIAYYSEMDSLYMKDVKNQVISLIQTTKI